MPGIKHLVQCNCFLHQFKRQANPPLHKFPVFSIFDENDNIIPKFVQCPNCGIVHKIIDVCKSEIQRGREDISSVITVEDIKLSFPEKLASLLETNDAPLSTWEEAQFAIENKEWGKIIVLSSETIGDSVQGKYVKIIGENLFKVDTFTRELVSKDSK